MSIIWQVCLPTGCEAAKGKVLFSVPIQWVKEPKPCGRQLRKEAITQRRVSLCMMVSPCWSRFHLLTLFCPPLGCFLSLKYEQYYGYKAVMYFDVVVTIIFSFHYCLVTCLPRPLSINHALLLGEFIHLTFD